MCMYDAGIYSRCDSLTWRDVMIKRMRVTSSKHVDASTAFNQENARQIHGYQTIFLLELCEVLSNHKVII